MQHLDRPSCWTGALIDSVLPPHFTEPQNGWNDPPNLVRGPKKKKVRLRGAEQKHDCRRLSCLRVPATSRALHQHNIHYIHTVKQSYCRRLWLPQAKYIHYRAVPPEFFAIFCFGVFLYCQNISAKKWNFCIICNWFYLTQNHSF